MNKPVTPNIAQLLREKGFDKPTSNLYINDELIYAEGRMCNWNLEPEYEEFEYPTSAPTISQVVMWLYEKHEIWLHPTLETELDENEKINVYFNYKINYSWAGSTSTLERFDNPTKAYEAAIEYALKPIIINNESFNRSHTY